jgi:hypothetical protein
MHADLLLYPRLLCVFDHGNSGLYCIYIHFFCYYFSKLTEGGSPVLIVNADQNLLGIIITKRAQETALRHFVERHLAVPLTRVVANSKL